MTSPDENGDTLAAAVIRLRKRAGSQAKLAKLLGTTERTIKRWEHGAVPNGKFRTALIAEGIPAKLFQRAEEHEEALKRLAVLEGELARLRELLERP